LREGWGEDKRNKKGMAEGKSSNEREETEQSLMCFTKKKHTQIFFFMVPSDGTEMATSCLEETCSVIRDNKYLIRLPRYSLNVHSELLFRSSAVRKSCG
jgi:hypothetical protein